jgi:hypothetical protein
MMTEKIRIGVATYEPKFHPETARSLRLLADYNKQGEAGGKNPYAFEVSHCYGTSSVFGRNYAAASKNDCSIRQKLTYDYLLSIDSDMTFTVENIDYAVSLLKDSENAGVVGGAYCGRTVKDSHLLVAGYFEKDHQGSNPLELWLPFTSKGVREVDWIGTGFMLIPKHVLEELDYPWFKLYTIIKDGKANLTTEDIAISMDIKNSGYKILLDCDNRIGHCIH